MNGARATALVADDEPLLRAQLVRQLAAAWPALEVVAEARNGREAVDRFERHRPDVCFLDVHMPGVSGIDAARAIAGRSEIVFVTAFDRYAVQAFEQGALDYLVKPVEPQRIAETAARLQARLQARLATPPVLDTAALLDALERRLARAEAPARLRWLQVSVGQALRVVAVDDVDYLRSDGKYTRVAWRGDGGAPAEGLVRTPLKQLAEGLDGAQFVQVHRAVVVNLRAVSHVVRGGNDTADIHLRGRKDVLPVSRAHLHLFRQM